ncbi:hypothetical protein [Streptomyces xiaopingdaonensis]|uniref:hypothetical protein n=1 Tax=Streptomyces xiaopingdaonensis TaxID=1565415 RepID=UPI0002F939D0|nr:hypothetical protein [Streptomyces xiaopingdaonensis]
MHVRLLRTVGAATAAYGTAVTLWPELLARPSRLVDAAGRTQAHTRTALRPVGLRDAASGAALLCAPEGPALRTAAFVRLAADFGDAALLGCTLPRGARGARGKAVGVSVVWGVLSLVGVSNWTLSGGR